MVVFRNKLQIKRLAIILNMVRHPYTLLFIYSITKVLEYIINTHFKHGWTTVFLFAFYQMHGLCWAITSKLRKFRKTYYYHGKFQGGGGGNYTCGHMSQILLFFYRIFLNQYENGWTYFLEIVMRTPPE